MKFQAFWPVADPAATEGQLIGEAIDDIHHVAARHGAKITSHPTFRFMPGRLVPGSGGADRVLVAQATCEPLPPRPYRAGKANP